jgi:hypothetical protein
VLAAGTRRAEDVHLDVFFANLDVDLLVHDGVHEDRREARVPARLRVEGRDAHQAVYAGLALE